MKRNKWKWMSVAVTGAVLTAMTATTAVAKERTAQSLKCTVDTSDGLSHEVELSPDRAEGDLVNVNDEYALVANRMKRHADQILLRLLAIDGAQLGKSKLLSQKEPSAEINFKLDGSVLHRVACAIEFAPEPSRKVSGQRNKAVQALTPEAERELREAVDAASAQ